MKENAILVTTSGVLKVYVDLSSDDAIKEAIDAEKLFTIHTQKLKQLSGKLGFHIMGYVDSEGQGLNNAKACALTGYDFLGSSLLLFKTDDKFNRLPLERNELDSLYRYITTGTIIPSNAQEKEREFFDKHHINPPLPVFDVNHKALFFDEYPNVICLVYNEFEAVTDSQINKLGADLFYYSDRVVNETDQVGEGDEGYNVSKAGDYYHKSYRLNGVTYVLIQAIDNTHEKPVLYDAYQAALNKYYPRKDVPDLKAIEDVPEEATDTDFDDVDTLVPYVLVIKVDATWPEHKETYLKGTYAFPLIQSSEEKIHIDRFDEKLFEMEGVDRIHDYLFLCLHFGEDQHIKLELDKDVVVKFDFLADPDIPQTHRVGEMTFRLEKYNFELEAAIKGKLKVKEEYRITDSNGVRDDFCEGEITNPATEKKDEDGEVITFVDTFMDYYVWLIDPNKDFLLVVQRSYDQENREVVRTLYYPLYANKPLECVGSFDDDEDDSLCEIRYKMLFEKEM